MNGERFKSVFLSARNSYFALSSCYSFGKFINKSSCITLWKDEGDLLQDFDSCGRKKSGSARKIPSYLIPKANKNTAGILRKMP